MRHGGEQLNTKPIYAFGIDEFCIMLDQTGYIKKGGIMVLHYLNDSRAFRILWLLEELALEYEVIYYSRDAKTLRAPEALKRIHPLGKSPILEANGQVWAESALILIYLARQHGPEWLPEPDGYQDDALQYWLHFSEGSLMPQLLLGLVSQKLGLLAWPIRQGVAAQMHLHLAYLEQAIAGHAWFLGEKISIADAMMSVPIALAVKRAGLSEDSHPLLWQWWLRVQARPAYQRALQKSLAG